MNGHFNKRALTTPVALILALMMVVAASTALLFWVTRLQVQEQSSVDNSQNRILDNIASCINIAQFSFNTLDNTSTAVLENCGNKALTIGDTLFQDSGVVSSQPCSFVINATTCSICPFTLAVNTLQDFKIYWNQTTCLSQISAGQKHQITLYVDKKATASRSFIPAPSVECGLSLTNNTALAQNNSGGVIRAKTYNFTLRNAGNTEDTFILTNKSTGSCATAQIFMDPIYDINWNNITRLKLSGGANALAYINASPSGDTLECYRTLTAQSSNCISKTASLLTNTSWYA